MTRKDFELIAEVLHDSAPKPQNSGEDLGYIAEVGQWVDTCERFAARLRQVNPRFDRARFLRACGVDDGR